MVEYIFILVYLLIFVLFLAILVLLVNLFVRKSEDYESFNRGNLPNLDLHGLYRTVGDGFWVKVFFGLHFDPLKQRSFNLVSDYGLRVFRLIAPFYQGYSKNEKGVYSAFVFNWVVDNSVHLKNKVVVISYKNKFNPWLLGVFREEIVEISGDFLLSKLYVNILPGLFLNIGFLKYKKVD